MEEKLKEAIKAEENFDFLNAVKIYQEIENQLEDELVLSRYAQLLIEFQDYEKAEIIYDKLLKIDSTNKEYNLKAAFIKEELKKEESAVVLYTKLKNDEKIDELNNKIKIKNPEKENIKKFMKLFRGREDVYAVQWFKDNQSGYRPIRRKISEQDVIQHFRGDKTLGIYQINNDNGIYFAAYDIDIEKGYEEKDMIWEKIKDITNKIYTKLVSYDIKSYIEYSGNKGYHIWIFFEEEVQAYKVKRFMEEAIKDIELKEGIHIEIFPKQEEVNGGIGNLIKIPLGIHKKTEKRCVFTDENLKEISNQTQFIMKIESNDIEKIPKIYNMEYIKNIQNKKIKNIQNDKKINYKIEKKYLKLMCEKCFVINQILKKIEEKGILNGFERYIFINSIPYREEYRKELHEILIKTIDYIENTVNIDFDSNRKIPLNCHFIKKIVSENNIGLSLEKCNCVFKDSYKSPANYIENIENYIEENYDENYIINCILLLQNEKYEIENSINQYKNILYKKIGENDEKIFEYGKLRKKDGKIEIIL